MELLTKGQIKFRLKRDGKWQEAEAYKEQRRCSYRDEGVARYDANRAAWNDMLKKFMPGFGMKEHETKAEEEMEGPPEHFASAEIDVERDALWVYHNLANRDITIHDAPSSGAWAMLKWAKRDANKFFTQILTKVVRKPEQARPDRPEDDKPGEDSYEFGEFERIVKEAVAESKKRPMSIKEMDTKQLEAELERRKQ